MNIVTWDERQEDVGGKDPAPSPSPHPLFSTTTIQMPLTLTTAERRRLTEFSLFIWMIQHHVEAATVGLLRMEGWKATCLKDLFKKKKVQKPLGVWYLFSRL